MLSKKRKAAFVICLVILALVAIELTSFLLYAVIRGDFSFPDRIRNSRAAILQSVGGSADLQADDPRNVAVHPYLGYVYNPEGVTKNGGPIAWFGFWDSRSPFRTVSEDTVVVGIFGGSFARWFGDEGTSSLITTLKESAQFQGKEFSIISTALGGYKQPQQLMVLNYLLALGATFDIVINLDGFNEVVLPVAENTIRGVFPFFPRNWYAHATSLPDPAFLRRAGVIELLDESRYRWASLLNGKLLRHSVVLGILWEIGDHWFASRIEEEQKALLTAGTENANDELPYRVTGPPYTVSAGQSVYFDLAEVWRRSSLQMHRLCAASGILYWHFLQPNQYVRDSKPMTERERKGAFNPGHPYKPHVRRGFPHLRRMGASLASGGVRFHDLTMIFADEHRPVYRDDCCHVNVLGNEILGREIASRILQSLSSDRGE